MNICQQTEQVRGFRYLGSLREVDRMKIEAFEMWIWRRLEKISWRDIITNEVSK